MVRLRAKGLSLQQCLVVCRLKLFDCCDFVSFKGSFSKQFVCVCTITTKQFFTSEAVADLNALFLTNSAVYLTSIATLSYSEKTQQTVLQKTSRQIIETISFRDVNFRLTIWASKLSLSLGFQCMLLQTLQAVSMKTSYGLRFG